MRPTIKVQRSGGKAIAGTPIATFGKDYYCQPEMNWPEACADRTRGPVAPEGHPQRLACEQHFLEQCGPIFKMDRCTGIGEQCPITFDPFICMTSSGEFLARAEALKLGVMCVNQNHPANVRAGCGGKFEDHETWVKVGGHVVRGAFWWATAHGKGYIRAENADGSVVGVSVFEIDQ